MKTNVYIDGFNFYYGAVKGTPYKWLDYEQLFRLVLQGHEIKRIRYFTALVRANPSDPQKRQRQQAYIRALETIPYFTVHYGHFLTTRTWMPKVNPPSHGPRMVEVIKTEEKGSDVNLATYLLVDGFADEYDLAVVVSNDSDLVEPINVIQSHLGKQVGVLNPHRNISRPLRTIADFYRGISDKALSASQFPNTVSGDGFTARKPSTW